MDTAKMIQPNKRHLILSVCHKTLTSFLDISNSFISNRNFGKINQKRFKVLLLDCYTKSFFEQVPDKKLNSILKDFLPPETEGKYQQVSDNIWV